MQFPAVDPIPIPAPVWLMKALSYATLALHFCAVMILVGSLLLVTYHNFVGRSRKDADRLTASLVIGRRLPVVMTYVINLGVPPLLFAQVLYGRALYTSSVLIGALWFAVIFLVVTAYWLIYRTIARVEANKAAWVLSGLTLLIVLTVGRIYTYNMTLMLRPEVWQEMYAASPSGTVAPSGDPAVNPRWLFVMSGGLLFGGLWALVLANQKHLSDSIRSIIRRSGGVMAGIGGLLQLTCGVLVFRNQPEAIQTALGTNMFAKISGPLAVATLALAAVLALAQGLRDKGGVLPATLGMVLGFLGNAGAVVYRDAIRDVTLYAKGFDVWARTENSNWSVIGVFLLLFVIMLAILGWLLKVMKMATPPREQVIL